MVLRLKKYQQIIAGLMIALLPFSAFAEDDKLAEVDGINFSIDADGQAATVVAPQTEKGYTGIIVIPATVEIDGISCKVSAIAAEAFENCPVEKVVVGKNVTNIGFRAFQGCDKLMSLTIDAENSKYYSSGNAIYYITGTADDSEVLAPRRHAIPISQKEIVLDACCMGTTEISAETTTIGEYAFCGCTSSKTLQIPTNVTKLYDTSFIGSTGLKILFAKSSTPAVVSGTESPVCSFYVYPEDWSVFSSDTYWGEISNLYLLGDVDIDKSLTREDPGSLAKHLVNLTPAAYDSFAADANCDGVVSLSDITTIVKFLQQWK